MTWKQLVKLAKKEYGMKKLIWSKDSGNDGSVCYWSGVVYINSELKKNSKFERRVHTLFHELGHIHAFNNGLWLGFHHGKNYGKLNKKEHKKMMLTGLKAELWVDKWARTEAKKFFPKYKFKDRPYYSERDKFKLYGRMMGYL